MDHALTDKHPEFVDRWLSFASIIFVELLSVWFVIWYFVQGAFYPYHRQAKWETEPNLSTTLSPPGFMLFGNYSDAVSADITHEQSVCHFPRYPMPCNGTTFATGVDGPFYWTYGDKLQYMSYIPANDVFTSATNQLLLQSFVQCKPSASCPRSHNPH